MALDLGQLLDNLLNEDSKVVKEVVTSKALGSLGPVLSTLIEGKEKIGTMTSARIDEYKQSSTDEEKKLRARVVNLSMDGEESINNILDVIATRLKS